jgi:hypothetical protein
MRYLLTALTLVLFACGSSPAPGGAGGADGGPSGADGGADAGLATGPFALAVSCSDTAADVYVTPTALPPFTNSERGAVVRCAVGAKLSRDALAARIVAAGVTSVDARGSVSSYTIAYRTDRGGGVGGIGSARVWLPDDPLPGASPIVVATHGTTGLADICAPSRFETVSDYISLPWVARGYPVVAPDYAGLGTEGVQGYGDNRDSASSTLDSARALRRLLQPGRLASKIVVAGHSQGGGAALAAQAFSRAYGDGDVVAAVAFAPGWQFRVDAEGLRLPNASTSVGGGVAAAVGALALYAYFANHAGADHAGDGFPTATRAALVGALESQCILQLAASVPTVAPTIGTLVDDGLRTSFIACVDTGTCVEPGKSYYDYSRANILPSDPQGGRVIVVQGLADVTATPARAACIVAKMNADGVTPVVCTDRIADHLDVVQRNMAFAVSWVEALLAGSAPPPCAASALPACAPGG